MSEDAGYFDAAGQQSKERSLRNSQKVDDSHFKQFFGGSQSSANQKANERYQYNRRREQAQYQLQQQQEEQNNRGKIDLENFEKFIQSSPQNYHNNYGKTSNNNTTVISKSQIENKHQLNSDQQQKLPFLNLSFDGTPQSGSGLENTYDSKISSIPNKSNLSQVNIKNNLSNSQSQQQLNRSYFFNGPERFIQDINSNYFDHSEINPLVDTKKIYQPQDDLEYSKIYERPTKQFSTGKLYLSSEGLRTSKEKKSELDEVKINLELRRQYNEEKDKRNRGYKLVKAAFRSGITHLDGPQESDTKIYQQESNKLLGRKSEEETRRQARLSYIEKYVTTNPAILFDNRQRTQFDPKKQMNFPHHVDEFQNGFLARQKNPSAIQYNSMSFDRLFGHNLADQKQNISSVRSKYLFSKDAYGKPQNIISNTVNPTLQYVQ